MQKYGCRDQYAFMRMVSLFMCHKWLFYWLLMPVHAVLINNLEGSLILNKSCYLTKDSR